MALTTNTSNGLLVLEKDLICSICTEVLFQPLTVLDCLHTFCGSCLKEWFIHQHRKASSARSSSSSTHPYTCPTCRAPARDTQRFSMINNFLENFLGANPDRDRSIADKEDMRAMYQPGENILPKVERKSNRRNRRQEEELAIRERQMVEEATQRSLREIHAERPRQSQHTLSPPQSTNTRGNSHEREERRQRRRDRERQREVEMGRADRDEYVRDDSDSPPASSPPMSSPRHPDAVEARHREQRMAHQSSLRSLVSASESGTGSNESLDEARVMQEILSEGLLDGIDVDALTEAEQDNLAARIAEIYRRRHPRRSTATSPSQEPSQLNLAAPATSQEHLAVGSQADRRRRSSDRQRAGTTPSPAREAQNREQSSRTTHPPSAMDRANSVTISHRRRTSDGQQSGTRAATSSRRSSPARPPSITRSAVDLSNNQEIVPAQRPRGFSATSRAITEPQHPPRITDVAFPDRSQGRRVQSVGPRTGSPPPSSRQDERALEVQNTHHSGLSSQQIVVAELDGGSARMSPRSPSIFDEPSVSCFRCLRHDIQYDLYKHCSICQVELCMPCYRKQAGCNHWMGFGDAALNKYEHLQQIDASTEPPHQLVSRQYRWPSSESVIQNRPSPKRAQPVPSRTTSNPAERLLQGHFCDRCGSFANSQFWLCDLCNDNEWGFCRSCVLQHHCCNHFLIPLKFTPPSFDMSPPARDQRLQIQLTPRKLSRPATPNSIASSNGASRLLSGYDTMIERSSCDICSQPIQPEHLRFHCPTHPTPTPSDADAMGDYDICTLCYHNLLRSNRLRREDGPDGWRKCPDGHRMIVLSFQPDESGSVVIGGIRRVVKHDLVGGWKMSEAEMNAWTQTRMQQQVAQSIPNSPTTTSPPLPGISSRGTWTWRDDPATNRRTTRSRASTLSQQQNMQQLQFPPEGGVGKQAIGMFSYFPEEGDDGAGELMFPRQGEITEIEEVNEDWWSGVYAGDVGVFPSGYVKEIR